MIIISHPARIIKGKEYFDNKTQQFFRTKDIHVPAIYLKLEHSLISMSKWESKWHKPFDPKNITIAELLDYVKCMNVNPSDQSDVYNYLSQKDLSDILAYMGDPQTAWVDPRENKSKDEQPEGNTVEDIYYAMVNLGLDPDFFGKWHINRLIALIKYFDYKGGSNAPGKGIVKKTREEILAAYHEINQKNRAKYKSKG